MAVFAGTPGPRSPRARSLAIALAVALGSTFAIVTPRAANAHIENVVNCADSGTGSLRDAVATAASGDTIDLSGLACSTITLTSGAIVVAQSALTIAGPGADQLVIDGDFGDRVLQHTGTSTLAVDSIAISNGKYVSDATPKGGCIASEGNVVLTSVTVSGCTLVGGDANVVARGGAIYASGNFFMLSSTLSGNTVSGTGTPISNSHGGAAAVRGSLTMKYSTADDNAAVTIEGHNSSAGAFSGYGSTYILGSTISNNTARFFGAMAAEGVASDSLVIHNSTISGNSAGSFSAIYTQSPTTITNSTIAFNSATYGRGALYSQQQPIELESTIIAANWQPGVPAADDLNGTDETVVTGANNLITSSSIAVPADTISACPRLRALADNGGPTRTHALDDASIAIDAGNNVAGLDEDQRGEARVFGVAADIGAYEWSAPVEFGFRSGFEGVCEH
jgi:hypothetical protein